MQDRSSPEPASTDRYEILDEIARGGMGVVYRVTDHNLDRILAMKRLGAGEKASSGDVQSDLFARFLEEVQVTAQLDHPAIVPVHDLGFNDDGTPFYTMRYVKLRNQILERQPDWGIVRFGRAAARANVSWAMRYQGLVDQALKQSKLATDEMEALLATDATNALYLVGMGMVMRAAVTLDLEIGNHARARATSQEASSYLKRALAGDPSNVRNQARLATFQRHEIDALSRLEPVSEEHVAALEKLITTLEQLALKQPKNPTLAEAWAETCLTTARLRAKTSPSRALKHLNKALSICQGQRNAIGNDNAAASFRWKLCHAACEKEAGRICKKTNDLQEANRHFDSSEKDYAALEDRLSVSETLELAELRLWKGSDKASIDNMLNDIDSRFTKRADLLKQLRDE